MYLFLLKGSNYNFLSKIVNKVTVNDVSMNMVTLLACVITALTKKVTCTSLTSLIRIKKVWRICSLIYSKHKYFKKCIFY